MAKILIIDDNRDICLILVQILKPLGYEVNYTLTGEEGLNEVIKNKPEAVLLDLNLPDVYGLRVLQNILAARPNTQVIVITAYGSVESAVEAIKLGAFDFVEKPFDDEVLASKISKALQSEQLSQEDRSFRDGQMGLFLFKNNEIEWQSASANSVVGVIELYRRYLNEAAFNSFSKEKFTVSHIKIDDKLSAFLATDLTLVPEDCLVDWQLFHERFMALDEVLQLDPKNAINELKDISARLERFMLMTKNFNVHHTPVKITDAINRAIAQEKSLIESAAVNLDLQTEVLLPKLWIDLELISMTIREILRNAIETLLLDRRVQLTVSQNKGDVEVIITNPGTIPTEEVDNILHPFYSTKKGHLGLGLSFARRIIREHHGKIFFDISKSKFTDCVLSIPIEERLF